MTKETKTDPLKVMLCVDAAINMLAPRDPHDRAAWIAKFGLPASEHKWRATSGRNQDKKRSSDA